MLRDVGYGVFYPAEPEQPEPPLYIEEAGPGSDGLWHTRYTLLIREAEKVCEADPPETGCQWRVLAGFWDLEVELERWRLCAR